MLQHYGSRRDNAPHGTSPAIPGHWMAASLGLSALTVVLLLASDRLGLAPRTPGAELKVVWFCGLSMVRLGLRNPASLLQQRLRDFAEDALLFTATALLGVLASYALAARTHGFVDAVLVRGDAALHFDWVAWYRGVIAHPLLRQLGEAAYAAIYVSPFVLLGWFAWAGQRFEARRFLLAFWLAEVLTLVLFREFPAEGPLAFLWRGPIPYMPTSALYQHQLIPALRLHRVEGIDMGDLRGLVCAPSFHTASAVLYMWAAWPIARLRWVLVPLNCAMLLATPIEGTHYLSDMLAGAVVAGCAIVAVVLALRWTGRRRHDRPELPLAFARTSQPG